jgi:G:T/U-mismatch repair DNA glycosylase
MQNRISSFPPLIDGQSEILILGSIPESNHCKCSNIMPILQNKFWKIIFELLNEEFTEDYSQRIETLKNIILPFGMLLIPVKEKEAWILRSEMKKPIRLQNCWKNIRTSKLFSAMAGSLTKTYKSCWEKL